MTDEEGAAVLEAGLESEETSKAEAKARPKPGAEPGAKPGMQVGWSAVTRVVAYEVRKGSEAAFRDWQTAMNAACSAFPGFVGFQMIPPSDAEGDRQWSLVYRFATVQDLEAWLSSPERKEILARGLRLVEREGSEYTIAGNDSRATGATLLAAHTVAPGKEAEYKAANDRLNEAASRFPGFVHVEDHAPSHPGGEWTTLLRFRDQASLDAWVASPEREEGRKELYAFLTGHRVERVASGFGSWFAVNAEDALASPAWKQTMAVLLGLFPTVMTLNLTVGSFLTAESLPFAAVVFVGNLLGTIVLSSLLMPVITKGLDWWLKPSCPPARTWLGIPLLLALYAGELLFFVFVWT